jgi:hypothetical protein
MAELRWPARVAERQSLKAAWPDGERIGAKIVRNKQDLYNKSMLRLTLGIIALLGLTVFLPSAVLAQGAGPNDPPGGNNQIVSRDAIGLRIVPNPEHFSPLQWYNKNITVKGAPQSLMVDGYEAVRDGRTVYVNAAKILRVNRCITNPAIVCQNDNQCGQGNPSETRAPEFLVPTAYAAGECQASSIPELYTNIYIISYNQDPEAATTDIFGQLLQYWKFNIDVKNCSLTVTQSCGDGANEGSDGCPNGEVCQPTGYCSQNPEQACVIDSDCGQGQYCNSKKSTIIRDTRRLADLRDVKDRLENYNTIVRRYPTLENGTYLTNRTISTWPSWEATFGTTLGSPLPSDPINKLGACPGYEAATCWNENTKRFGGTPDPLTLPPGSKAYYYQYKASNNSFSFCSIIESGYIQAKSPNSPYCATGQVCNRNCSGRQCGDDGCGGTCGTCGQGRVCQSGICRSDGTIQQEE